MRLSTTMRMKIWAGIHASTWTSALVLLSILVTGAAGCGQDDPAVSTPADRARFVGTWNVVTATMTLTCTQNMMQVLDVTEPTVFILGTTSDLMDTGPDCPLRYNVLGHTATALAGQTCDDPKLITTVHVTDDTFVTADGVSGTHHGAGRLSAFIDLNLGSPVNCNWVADGTYQHAAP